MIHQHIKKTIFSLVVILSLSACSERQRQGLQVKEPALGKAASVLVVAEENVWGGPAGKAFQDSYETLYGVLPQPEFAYDLKYAAGEDFRGVLKEWRVIVFLDILGDKTPTDRHVSEVIKEERIRKAMEDPSYNAIKIDDPWARGQHVFMFFAQNQAALIEAFKAKENTIKRTIDELDAIQLEANNYQSGHNAELNKKIATDLGIKMDLPGNFELATYDSLANTMWMRKETAKSSFNILLKTLEYTDQSQLTKQNLVSIRDSLGKQLITTAAEDAFMKTEQKNMIVEFSEINFKENYAIKAEGLWKMQGDFMGGPFVSYLVYNKDLGKLVFLDGFIHAPGESKREKLQELDLILNRLGF